MKHFFELLSALAFVSAIRPRSEEWLARMFFDVNLVPYMLLYFRRKQDAPHDSCSSVWEIPSCCECVCVVLAVLVGLYLYIYYTHAHKYIHAGLAMKLFPYLSLQCLSPNLPGHFHWHFFFFLLNRFLKLAVSLMTIFPPFSVGTLKYVKLMTHNFPDNEREGNETSRLNKCWLNKDLAQNVSVMTRLLRVRLLKGYLVWCVIGMVWVAAFGGWSVWLSPACSGISACLLPSWILTCDPLFSFLLLLCNFEEKKGDYRDKL